MDFKHFTADFYPEYSAWFSDAELNRQLGPMDTDWLDWVLAQPEAEGATWAVFEGDEPVAVIETVLDPQRQLPAAITGLAVKPSLRGQGIGAAVLGAVLERHQEQGIGEHVAYIHEANLAGRRCAQKVGFAAVTGAPDEHGYVEFRQRVPGTATP